MTTRPISCSSVTITTISATRKADRNLVAASDGLRQILIGTGGRGFYALERHASAAREAAMTIPSACSSSR